MSETKEDRIHLDSIPQPCVRHGWVIIGPYYNVWGYLIFDKPEQAWAHIEAHWKERPYHLPDFRVMKGKATFQVLGIETMSAVESARPNIDQVSP